MTDFGVVPEGFVLKTLDDILTELSDAEKAAFGDGINTNSDSVLGQLNALLGDQFAQLWKVGLAVYRSLQPDFATGDALDNLSALTGAVRIPARASTVALRFNVGATVTVPAGSKVSIGINGAQWVTLEDADNSGGAVPDTIQVNAESDDEAAVVGNAYAINTIATPISGWSAKAALGSGSEPFELEDGETLTIVFDDGDAQTIAFDAADFVDITAATALEVIDVINDQLTDGEAIEGDGGVRLQSETDGVGSSVEVTGGSANVGLGFSAELVKGFNWSTTAKVDFTDSPPYTLADAMALEIIVDDVARTVTFSTGSFADITNATQNEVCDEINSQIGTYARAYIIDGNLRVESLTRGNNSSLNVSASAAATALGAGSTGVTFAGESGDAVVGQDVETDADFRVRREELLRLSGASTVEAIRSAVRALDGVNQAFVFENETDTTDVDGLPPHSIEAVISGGDEDEIGETLWETKAGGIQTYRDPGAAGRTVTITDSQGFTHDMHFTRPTDIDMYVEIDITVDADVFGGGVESAGIAEVQAAIVAAGADLNIGDDVVVNKILAAAIDVAGVLDVTHLEVDDVTPTVTTANFVVAAREIALFSAARITVNVS